MLKNRSQGFTLLEVVVSLSLVTLLILCLQALELYSQQKRINSYHRHLARRQLNNIKERLQMLQGREDYQEQENLWNLENTELLPRARGEVAGTYPNYLLKLCWGSDSDKGASRKCLAEKVSFSC